MKNPENCTSIVVIGCHSVAISSVDDLHSRTDVPAVVRHHVELGVHAAHHLIDVTGMYLVNC